MTVEHFIDKTIKPLAVATGLVVLFIAGLVTYWLVCPYKVIDLKSEYQTEKLVYTKGESTFYVVDYCKYIDAPATITKEFVDGLVFTVDSPQALLNVGCRRQEVPMTIPKTLPAGKYRLRNIVTYQVNPIRTVVITNYSNWFEVKLDPVTHLDAEQDIND